jgi:hypothetical protein
VSAGRERWMVVGTCELYDKEERGGCAMEPT